MSWWFLAAIHGTHPLVWHEFGLVDANEQRPPEAVQQRVWNQCQHQSWYFLPWHRGYLVSFERIARAAVVAAGGPTNWAVPYWDYSDATRPDSRVLPSVFADPTLPDGSPNPLNVERRYGDGRTPIVLDERMVSLRALADTEFAGGTADIPPGFGGPRTLFHHGTEGPSTFGTLETLPHNVLHTVLGGSAPGQDPDDWRNLGLMTMPITAALDPIFWLHHANIDRVWEVWRRENPDISEPGWLDGPADRSFVVPTPEGGEWIFTAREMLDTAALGYYYDSLPIEVPVEEIPPADEVPVPRDEGRRRIEERATARGRAAVDASGQPELVGASDIDIVVHGMTDTPVRVDGSRMRSFQRDAARRTAPAAPPRVFLKLEGIRGPSDAAVYYVYVDVPSDEDPEERPDRLAGTVSLFGVSEASDPDGAHLGSGISQVLEISDIVDAGALEADASALDVRFVPANDTVARAEFSVGRVSIYVLE
ncbi:MAG: tyrosinase family protein [Gulosibacter sp.]|uniref:tyrosinase family protein n=1 Tax=Gulosibacter sp. TaxID=2817531 RepID=UPI003F8F3FF7